MNFAQALIILLLALTPVQDGQVVRQSEAHFSRAVELQQKGDLQGAREAYEASLKLIPRRSDALSNLGIIHAKLGQYEKAISSYKTALEIDPAENITRLNLGIAYYQTEHFIEAQTEFQQVVKAQPENFQARFLNGMCLFYAGKFNPAIVEFEKVYAVQPENISVAYALANAYIQNEQIDKGQLLIDKVFRNLNSAEAHLIIGSFNLARKELQPAAEELKQAVEINPKLPTAHSQLGVVYLMTGNRDLAIKAFQDELALILMIS